MRRERNISWILFVWTTLTNIIPVLLHRPVLTKMAFIGTYKVPRSIFVFNIGFLNQVKTILPIINKYIQRVSVILSKIFKLKPGPKFSKACVL